MTSAERLAALDAVVYADLFDCAVDLDEIWRYSRSKLSRAEIRQLLAEPAVGASIGQRGGFYFLAGREQLADLREDRRRRSASLRRRAARVAGWLRHVPFVRGILLTGSVAADNATRDADVDVMLIVADGRIATVFALLGSASRLLSRRMLCPNYYISEAHLKLTRRDHYVAREIAQARPLAGNADSLQVANRWIEEFLPNARGHASAPPELASGGSLQRGIERLLRGPFGDRVEARAQRLAHARLAAHHAASGEPVPDRVSERFDAGIELRFHESGISAGFVERYEARRRDTAAALERAGA